MMTSKLLFAATAALTISSCTMQEVDDVAATPREPIRFEQFVGKTTRGEDVTTETLKEFRVLGKIYKTDGTTEGVDIKVTKSGDAWTYDNTLYWEYGNRYCFAATNFIVPSNNATQGYKDFQFESETANEFSLTCPQFVNPNEVSQYIGLQNMDIVTAVFDKAYIGKATGNGTVVFDFKHALAKVQLTFVNNYENGHDVDISGISVSGVDREAAFTQTNGETAGSWSSLDGPASHGCDDISLSKQGEEKSVVTYVLPQDIKSGHEIHFEIEATDGDRTVKIPIPTDVINKWEAGKAYNYKFTIYPKSAGSNAVEFGANIGSWSSESGDVEPLG